MKVRDLITGEVRAETTAERLERQATGAAAVAAAVERRALLDRTGGPTLTSMAIGGVGTEQVVGSGAPETIAAMSALAVPIGGEVVVNLPQ